MSNTSKQIVEKWSQIKSLDPYILASRNRRFLDGKSGLLARMDDYVMGFVGWCLFLLALFAILISVEISNLFRIACGLLWIIMLFIGIRVFRKYYMHIHKFAQEGSVIVGTIEEFVHTGQGADFLDHAYFKVMYSFITPGGMLINGEGKTEHSESAVLPVGRSVVVLYVNDNKFMAL